MQMQAQAVLRACIPIPPILPSPAPSGGHLLNDVLMFGVCAFQHTCSPMMLVNISTAACAFTLMYLAKPAHTSVLLQTILLAYNLDGYTGAPAPTGANSGPTDDGQIIVAYNSNPQDPYCCKGPNINPDGACLRF